MKLLELAQVSCQFGDVKAIKTVSFSVTQGQFITLLGPSGCGKTTTLRLIAGFETPASGVIRFKDRIFASEDTFVAPKDRHIGMVFQDYALFPHLNVAQNIGFGLHKNTGNKTERINEMLELVGLTDLKDRMPFELSGGQQQRVALARALAPQPDMLLLDEPFSNLDAALRTQLRTEMAHILRKTNTTCIFVTHAQDEALSLSDQIAVMFDGTIEQFATPQQLYEKPATVQVATFIGEANLIDGQASGETVETALGTYPLDVPKSGQVTVIIRPEWLSLAHTDDASATTATITWIEYYGHDRRIGLQLANGHQFIARSTTTQPLRIGDHVSISINHPLLAYNK